MTTPDSFFNIKPDFKPGTVNRDSDRDSPVYDVKKPYEPPRTGKEFKEVLDDQEKKTGQPVTLTKESKVAPRVGKEMPIAPAEEPRAEPYIEQVVPKDLKIAPSIFDLSKGKADDKLHQGHMMEKAVPAGIEEEIIPLTNKPAPQIDPLTGSPVILKPRLPSASLTKDPLATDANAPPDDVLAGQEADALLGQDQVKNAAANQDVLSKIASYFQPLVAKFLGDNPKLKGSLDNSPEEALPAADASLLAQANVLPQTVAPITTSNQVDVEVQTAPQSDIDTIASQIIDSITTTKTSTQTDTTITLKHPPILDGAVLTVTSFKAAPNDIRVVFENLTQDGKNLLDNIGNRTALDSALDQKGITMHMITTTTYVENLNFGDSSSLAREKREGKGGQPGFGGQGRQKDNQDQA